jgi:hypothetical protein
LERELPGFVLPRRHQKASRDETTDALRKMRIGVVG